MGTRAVLCLVLCAVAPLRLASAVDPRAITFEDRVAAQKAIEQVYWSHRLWPKDNPSPKPPLSAVLTEAAILAKVERYLKESNTLDQVWRRPITAGALQAELDRMTRDTRDPNLLHELFASLGNDPVLIAETLARPSLAARLARTWYAGDERFHGALRRRAQAALASCRNPGCMKSMGGRYVETIFRPRGDRPSRTEVLDDRRIAWLDPDEWTEALDRWTTPAMTLGPLEETVDAFSIGAILSRSDRELSIASVVWDKQPFDAWWEAESGRVGSAIDVPAASYTLAAPASGQCAVDTWSETPYGVEPRMRLSAVWTGTEMIVWGGVQSAGSSSESVNSGGRYNPATDSWIPTSRGANTPSARYSHTAVWTGTRMIVWGGIVNGPSPYNGGRYDPSTDSWVETSMGANLPAARYLHTAVWTGTEMIVWGGQGSAIFNSGGRYNPSTDSWTATSTGASVPTARFRHTAVWTGSEMIVWGGTGFGAASLPSGGRYDPSTDSWRSTSLGTNAPSARDSHSAVWTGSAMIVWGGTSSQTGTNTFTGGRYDPVSDSWLLTALSASMATARNSHTAVWSGTEMIVWGGYDGSYLNSGSRYNPSTDSWALTSSGANVPSARLGHVAAWTGTEMIVWGGSGSGPVMLNSGGRYSPSTNSWVATSITSNGAPAGRAQHTAVWTGAEMIVWGGANDSGVVNTGGRYAPVTNSWLPTSTGAHVPASRYGHAALWTGSEMIIWGGSGADTGARYDPAIDKWKDSSAGGPLNGHAAVWSGTEMIVWSGDSSTPGGRYNPTSNSWTSMSTAGAPPSRIWFSAVWTGSEVIVWGGIKPGGMYMTSGGRYNPAGDSWLPTSPGPNVPIGRYDHTAVWTGSEMIVWGGHDCCTYYVNSGGRYDPVGDSWLPTSISSDTPSGRTFHTSVWSGAEMIVWGGIPESDVGGRYRPSSDSWQPTTSINAPSPRSRHTAVWTGGEMIVWGGGNEGPIDLASGGRYCAESCSTEICNLLDDDCDGLVDEDASGVDTDGDAIHNACDVCPAEFDPAQSDADHDGQGDLCDLDDGIIYVLGGDRSHIAWQGESGPSSWNVYEGDLDVLRASGTYTQPPGSNGLANRRCGVTSLSVDDTLPVPPGAVKFSLIAGVTSGVEGTLGTDGENQVRPNTNPCP